MNDNYVSGTVLKAWRESRQMSLRDVAALLGVSSASTVNAWENGQDIPGPAQLLLRMLIHGEVPFGTPEDTTDVEQRHFWQLKLTLADWHKLEALATAGGFGTVRDYLLSLIQEHLNHVAVATKAGCGGLNSGHESVDEGCSTPSLSVSTVISSETGQKAPSPPSSAASIVPLPTRVWSGSGDAKAAGTEEKLPPVPPSKEVRTKKKPA